MPHSKPTQSSSEDKWAVSGELLQLIHDTLEPIPYTPTILELGSGQGTHALAQNYRIYSIEHDEFWVGHCPDSTYIHAPIQPFNKKCAVFPDDLGWYDRSVLRRELPKLPSYDLILVDGPTGEIGRGGFYKWLDLFATDVPIIFDDVHRKREWVLVQRVSAKLRRSYTVHGAWTDCHFAIIYP